MQRVLVRSLKQQPSLFPPFKCCALLPVTMGRALSRWVVCESVSENTARAIWRRARSMTLWAAIGRPATCARRGTIVILFAVPGSGFGAKSSMHFCAESRRPCTAAAASKLITSPLPEVRAHFTPSPHNSRVHDVCVVHNRHCHTASMKIRKLAAGCRRG